eukprot:GSA25T00018887001.1
MDSFLQQHESPRGCRRPGRSRSPSGSALQLVQQRNDAVATTNYPLAAGDGFLDVLSFVRRHKTSAIPASAISSGAGVPSSLRNPSAFQHEVATMLPKKVPTYRGEPDGGLSISDHIAVGLSVTQPSSSMR